MLITHDPLGAFMHHPPVEVASASEGPLAGLTLAVKDIFDVQGYPTGCGQPLRLEEAAPAERSAPAVQTLLDAGAVFVGKTITDELAFSLNGQNAHYGTPLNPAAPERIPGGSSSGSASATAGGLVDFALGSDTGGSVRAPASYCGLYGLRPSHGRIPLDGVMPLAPSLDTVGWFARDAEHYRRIGRVLIPDVRGPWPERPEGVLVEDAFALMDAGPRAALDRVLGRIEAVLGALGALTLAADGLERWFTVFRTVQGREAWQAHGAWIESRKPDLGPGVRERFEWSRGVSEEAAAGARKERAAIRTRVCQAVGEGGVLVLPTVPSVAPLKETPIEELEDFRNRALSILCISGLSGLPQMSLPLAEWEGAPLGVSLIGPEGSEHMLMDLAVAIAAAS